MIRGTTSVYMHLTVHTFAGASCTVPFCRPACGPAAASSARGSKSSAVSFVRIVRKYPAAVTGGTCRSLTGYSIASSGSVRCSKAMFDLPVSDSSQPAAALTRLCGYLRQSGNPLCKTSVQIYSLCHRFCL